MTFHLGSTGFSFIELSAWCPFENDSDDNDTTQWHCLQPMIWGDGTPPCYFYHVAQASQISKSALSNIRWGKKKLRSQGYQPDKVMGSLIARQGRVIDKSLSDAALRSRRAEDRIGASGSLARDVF